MTLAQFRQALTAAFGRHVSAARMTIRENRGVFLTAQAEVAADVFISVYFNALTGKTSYALIRQGQHVAGLDNYRYWHRHSDSAPDQHVPCAAPTPDDAIAELVQVLG